MEVFQSTSLAALALTLLTSPRGPAVSAVLERYREWMRALPDADFAIFQSLSYTAYRLLCADGEALIRQGLASPELRGAVRAAEVMEQLRDGTGCYFPTGDPCELSILPSELRESWTPVSDFNTWSDGLVDITLESALFTTHNYPLATELTQHLVSYALAAALEKTDENVFPRGNATRRTVLLAQYTTPWERVRSVGYLCDRDGEVFFLAGDITDGTCEDYLDAIRQAEETVPHETSWSGT